MREHPVRKKMKFHAGTDVAAAIGTPVVAIADGTVELVAGGGAAEAGSASDDSAKGIDADAVVARYGESFEVNERRPPSTVANLSEMGSLPTILVGFLAGLTSLIFLLLVFLLIAAVACGVAARLAAPLSPMVALRDECCLVVRSC